MSETVTILEKWRKTPESFDTEKWIKIEDVKEILNEYEAKVSELEKQLNILNEEAISRIGIQAKLKVDLESAREVIQFYGKESEMTDSVYDRPDYGELLGYLHEDDFENKHYGKRAREWMKGNGK